MYKYITIATLSILTATVAAKGKWDVGIAGGWGMTKPSETLTQYSSPGDIPDITSRYKFNLRGSGPVAGITAGYTIQCAKNTYGLMIGAYKDFYTARNEGPKNDTLDNIDLISKNDIKRDYTLEFSGKIGHFISPDTQLYGKLGVLRSQFQEQFRDPLIDVKHKVRGWGGVLGFGIQKSYESVKVGLEYTYQYYERVGTTMHYDIASVPFKNHSKFRPQYHALLLTISKTF